MITDHLRLRLSNLRLPRGMLWACGWALLLLLLARHPVAAQSPPGQPSTAPPIGELVEEINAHGNVPLIVQFDIEGTDASVASVTAVNEAAIANAQQQLLARLAAYQLENVKAYAFTPHLALTLFDEEALALIYEDPSVIAVHEDIPVPPLLDTSVPVIGGNFSQILFYNGVGQAVAILDTGVAKFHPDLAGKIVSEACYSTTNAGQGSTSLCFGGVSSSVGNNSGVNCGANIAGCDHGTHVAGIAAGVAPGASLIAMQVFSRFDDTPANPLCANAGRTSPCTLSYQSDQLAALQRVFALRNTFNIASVNMSLGSGQITGSCNTNPLKPTIDLLRNDDIATVIAAGNSSFRNAMGQPACISTAVSVGATQDNDLYASFTNVSSLTTMMAPGFDIYAPIPPDATDNKNGTSMAAPHVAGAWAVLKAVDPSATVGEIQAAIINSGINVNDNRTGGINSKRRIRLYNALCSIISCDGDDYRNVTINSATTGSVSPANDRDHYFYQAVSGTRLTIQLNRTSGTLDPYVELFSPTGVRIALNNNGGTGTNALINNFLLTSTGRYMIVARGANANTGGYSLVLSSTAVNLNPTPIINTLSPASATGNFFASDFWVAINGSGFLPTSQTRWNGSLRTTFYSSPTRIWIRVRGSDLGFPWPRTAFITVVNPAPGGGTSNARSFPISFPFLGESNLLQPTSGATVTTGISTTFVISWTAPITAENGSWRSMQNMDLRLRDENNQVAAWIRVTEHVTETSTMRLLNSAETILSSESITDVVEGIPGVDTFDIVITDTVTLHLGASAFSGSGLTAIMSLTVTFGPNAIGTYNVEFRVDGPDGEVQDEDVLGEIHIVSATCPAAVASATLTGTNSGTVGNDYAYTLDITPVSPTSPYTITWAPEPKTGQGTTNATYNWDAAGVQSIFASVENCGGFAADVLQTQISTGSDPDFAISKRGPESALPGEVITYTLTITNRGAMTATNVVISDTLPSGVTYVAGGTLAGNDVTFSLSELGGYAAYTTVDLSVQALPVTDVITNSVYTVRADGGHSATGSVPVVTVLADAQVEVAALLTGTLSYPPDAVATVASVNALSSISATFPAGSVFGDAVLALFILESPPITLPTDQSALGSFRLDGFQEGEALVNGFVLGEEVPLTIAYGDSSVDGLDEATLALLARTGSTWSSEGITCAVNSSTNQISCTLGTPTLTDYVLVASPAQDPDPDPEPDPDPDPDPDPEPDPDPDPEPDPDPDEDIELFMPRLGK